VIHRVKGYKPLKKNLPVSVRHDEGVAAARRAKNLSIE
jgi:hypothetical protein